MKAVAYKGPFPVAVEDVPDPGIEAPTDAIVQITSTCICGSDLHRYEGRTGAEPGIVFGHENQGVVVEVGPGVATVGKGDRVTLPFNVGCELSISFGRWLELHQGRPAPRRSPDRVGVERRRSPVS